MSAESPMHSAITDFFGDAGARIVLVGVAALISLDGWPISREHQAGS
jgi:hypothetical protein